MTVSINQELIIYEGDSFTYHFPILESDGDAATLSNPIAYWALFPGSYFVEGDQSILFKDSLTGGGIRIEQSSGVWNVYVDFFPEDTEDKPEIKMGKHYYELAISDGGKEQTIATGILTVLPTGLRP